MNKHLSSPFLTHTFKYVPSTRWVYLSALQKAIRRNQLETALRAAFSLMQMEPKTLWQRLVIIGFEDIGLGDLPLLHKLVSVEHSSMNETVVVHLIAQMCEATKDRTLVNLYNCSTQPPAHVSAPHHIVTLARAGARLTHQSFCHLLPFAWAMIQRSSSMDVRHTHFPVTPTLKGWPMEAFCPLYTREGKRCLHLLVRTCQPIQEFLAKNYHHDSMGLLGYAFFHTEGALLERRLIFEGSEDLYQASAEADMMRFGLNGDEARTLLHLSANHLTDLNTARQKILTSDNSHLSEVKMG